MAFDIDQASFKEFREILKENTNQVVVFAGAGLSSPAGIPSWSELKRYLIELGIKEAKLLDEGTRKKTEALLNVATLEQNPWKAFEHIQNAIGITSFSSGVREALKNVDEQPPNLYEKLWSLGITAFLTLNIDSFTGRSFSKKFPGQRLREFNGLNVNQHTDAFKSGTKFVANLHGLIDDDSSWVFTETQFDSLVQMKGYQALLQTCFLSKTVLFIGISANDKGASRHLQQLVDMGLATGNHFWLTTHNDSDTNSWADKLRVRKIIYTSKDGDHSDLDGFVDNIKRYKPIDLEPAPVPPSTKRERGITLPPPEEVEKFGSNEIRTILGKEAARILQSSSPTRIADYSRFWKEYEEAIYRAWSVSTEDGKNFLFDYMLICPLARGAFGFVYKALDKNGKEVAIKILHGNIREEPQMLEAFRRGIAAMDILHKNGISGMVPYIAAWEIPTCCVMELIDGPNLEQAVVSRQIDDWGMILNIALDIASILRKAHQLPERVLHRDVRPANIMLKDYDHNPVRPNIVVLDFDLSWHRDASGLSIDLTKNSNGYHAPEQLDSLQKAATRNALVDSFGLGMTLYFLASKKHPRPSQHTQVDWDKILAENVINRKCGHWKSLSRRFSRIIDRSTQDKQQDRWDLTRIMGELSSLKECLESKSTGNVPLENLCEEIASRCPDISEIYKWNVDRQEARVELTSGFTIALIPNDEKRQIGLYIEWLHTGDKIFKDVKKFVATAADKVCSELKAGAWVIEEKIVSASDCKITAFIDPIHLQNIEAIQKSASALSDSVGRLRFG